MKFKSKSANMSGTKSLKDFIKKKAKKGTDYFLCNEKAKTKLVGKVHFEWDHFNSCPGVYFEEHESYLNIIDDRIINDDFATFYNTPEGFALLKEGYKYFSKK